MENKDIDNIFAHKFGQMPGDAYAEGQWSSLSSRLDTHENRRRRWLLLVLLPLFALLAAGNVFWWYQWREAVRFNHSQEDTTTLFQTDTVVTTTVIHRFDTIYQNTTIALRQYQGTMTLSEQQEYPIQTRADINNGAASTAPANKEKTNTKQAEDASVTKPNAATDATDPFKPGVTVEAKPAVTPECAETVDNPAHKEVATDHSDSTSEQNLKTPPPTQKVKSPAFYVARPRLGISAGWSTPLSEHSPKGYLLGFGLAADVEMVRNLRLGAAFDYWTGKLEAQETEGLTWVDVPNPGNNYDLKHWETGQLAALTYALNLRYQIPLKSNWTPWVGMGAQATTQLPFDIAFEYENEVDDEELTLTEQTKTQTHFQGMLLLLGVESKIGRQFSWGAEGFWLFPLAEESGMLNNQLGLKTRLYYHF